MKNLQLGILTLGLISYTNAAEDTEGQTELAKPGRSKLTASMMTLDEDDLLENDNDTTNTKAKEVPSLVSTPTTLPSPKEPSAKVRSPKVRYNHNSFSGPIAKRATTKNSK